MRRSSLHLIWAVFVFFLILAAGVPTVEGSPWQEEKSRHFIIRYQDAGDQRWARDVLRAAEDLYDRIGRQLGFARYHNFWTWENRTEIRIYPDQRTFLDETQQPEWSRAGAVHHQNLFSSRKIVTFRQEGDFLTDTLPHEIAHLILHDFIGPGDAIPVWFDEGVAQLFERDKVLLASVVMPRAVARQQYFPMAVFSGLDIRRVDDQNMVAIFYLQSVSVVDFLIKRFGQEKFARLCREMRSGKDFEAALYSAYTVQISSLAELEKIWLSYIQQF